jgi:hypothetical protein
MNKQGFTPHGSNAKTAIARDDPNSPPAKLDPTDTATVREIGLLGL